MAGLEDLGKLLPSAGKEQPRQKPKWQLGYDGLPMRLKVRTEKRRGKLVTIAQGFQSRPVELQRLLAMAKSKFGAGGQLTDNAIELQGDHVDRMKALLEDERYLVR